MPLHLIRELYVTFHNLRDRLFKFFQYRALTRNMNERFPDGVLMEERAATRILSLCQLGRNEEATEQGHHFLLAHPRSVYAERVRHSCVGGR